MAGWGIPVVDVQMASSNRLISGLVHLIHRYLIWVIVGSYLVAAVLPGLGLAIRHASLGQFTLLGSEVNLNLPQLMLATLLFNAGLGVRQDDLARMFTRPRVLLAGLLGNVLVPLVFIIGIDLPMRTWHNGDEVQQILVGLALVGSMPIAGASTAWAQNANGNLALSLGLVLLTTFLSPLLTPLVLHAVGFVTSGDYSSDLHELASDGVVSFLGVWVLLPSVLGILTRRLMGESRYADRRDLLKLVNYLVLILLNYSNAALTLPDALSRHDWDFLALILFIVTALCLVAFAAGYLIAHYFHADRNSKVSLMFALGMNNNGTGLVLASVALANHPQVMLPIIFYNLVQHLVASIVDRRFFAQGAANSVRARR
jgi:BASS family bile acid:Na+ symporter